MIESVVVRMYWNRKRFFALNTPKPKQSYEVNFPTKKPL